MNLRFPVSSTVWWGAPSVFTSHFRVLFCSKIPNFFGLMYMVDVYTLPATFVAPENLDGWKTILSFWDDLFSGAKMLISGRVFQIYLYIYQQKINPFTNGWNDHNLPRSASTCKRCVIIWHNQTCGNAMALALRNCKRMENHKRNTEIPLNPLTRVVCVPNCWTT